MKIAVIGYSGAGKSTLARKLAAHYNCEALHLDSVHFTSGWIERSDEEMLADVGRFMEKENWVIDGNYSGILYQRRMDEADRIVFMNFNRFDCFRRAYKRYWLYKGKTRPDLADGCGEKFDWGFIRWILWGGRSDRAKKRYQKVIADYPRKTVVLNNQSQLDQFLRQLSISA